MTRTIFSVLVSIKRGVGNEDQFPQFWSKCDRVMIHFRGADLRYVEKVYLGKCQLCPPSLCHSVFILVSPAKYTNSLGKVKNTGILSR